MWQSYKPIIDPSLFLFHTSQELSFLPFQGSVNLKNPDQEFSLLLDYGNDPNATTEEPLRLFFGRKVRAWVLPWVNFKPKMQCSAGVNPPHPHPDVQVLWNCKRDFKRNSMEQSCKVIWFREKIVSEIVLFSWLLRKFSNIHTQKWFFNAVKQLRIMDFWSSHSSILNSLIYQKC